MSPFFSIIVPLYNSKEYVIHTIKSIENQSYKNFELIIVDDHSTDNSSQIVTEYLKQSSIRYQLLIRPDNLAKGVASCRNFGVEKSSGLWLCFLDSDDLFHPDKLKHLRNHIETDSNEVFHHAVDFIDEKGNVVKKESSVPVRNTFYELIKGNTIVTSSVCVSKAFLNSIGQFDTELYGVEDYFMWLKIAKNTTWKFIDYPLSYYRLRNDSLMGGRRLSYYVNENIKLESKVKNEIEIDPNELKVLEENVFFSTMKHYVSISLNKYGYADFIKGIFMLSRYGKVKYSLYFLRTIHRNILFSFLSKGKRKIIQQSGFIKKAKKEVWFHRTGKISNTILISSMGRSGSTWLAQLINCKNNYREIFEPFLPVRVPEANSFTYCQYIPPLQNSVNHELAARKILSGKFRNEWTDNRNSSLFSNKRLIKDIRTNLMLAWFNVKFPDLRIILLIRHPFSVISSWRKLGWGIEPIGNRRDLDIIISQPGLLNDYPIIKKALDTFDTSNYIIELAVLWSILNYVPFVQNSRSKFLTILKYEEIVENLEKESKSLFASLNIPWSNKVMKVANRPSNTSYAKKQFVSMDTMLTEGEKETVKSVVGFFGLHVLYPETLAA